MEDEEEDEEEDDDDDDHDDEEDADGEGGGGGSGSGGKEDCIPPLALKRIKQVCTCWAFGVVLGAAAIRARDDPIVFVFFPATPKTRYSLWSDGQTKVYTSSVS